MFLSTPPLVALPTIPIIAFQPRYWPVKTAVAMAAGVVAPAATDNVATIVAKI